MISIQRPAEPQALAEVRTTELPRVRALQDRTATAIGTKYGVARKQLFECQGRKCCYCERGLEGTYEDVEHYRPKVRYWWLAWSWDNLLYACPQCNRGAKGEAFPLVDEGQRLQPEQPPPGNELPLLLDPAVDNPIEHIEFRRSKIEGKEIWRAYARASSERGRVSIDDLLALNRESLVGRAYKDHVNDHIRHRVKKIRKAMDAGDLAKARHELDSTCRRLLRRASIFAALSYDVLRTMIPATTLEALNTEIPAPPID
jgi:uncharacterized protein (TIGR02646 family)